MTLESLGISSLYILAIEAAATVALVLITLGAEEIKDKIERAKWAKEDQIRRLVRTEIKYEYDYTIKTLETRVSQLEAKLKSVDKKK